MWTPHTPSRRDAPAGVDGKGHPSGCAREDQLVHLPFTFVRGGIHRGPIGFGAGQFSDLLSGTVFRGSARPGGAVHEFVTLTRQGVT